jgi:UDPglucose 6-dehydrogenase
MIKYGSNVMLASRLAAVNELAELSEILGGDIGEISSGIGMDRRIGPDFLKAGPGFGGSCFGKDVAGIVMKAKSIDVEMPHIGEIIKSNNHQKVRSAYKLEKLLGTLKGKKIAVLGLAFKADTDDVRGSAAFEVINYLIEKKAVVKAHDPRAEYNFIRDFKRKGYSCAENAADALSRADAAVILTDWDEYSKLTPDSMSALMHGRVIVDTRNMFDELAFRQKGFTFQGTGRPAAAAKTRKRSEFVNAAIVSM